MRTKLAPLREARGFERVLEAVAQELIACTDGELLEACKDLGMDPTMRGSAAFIGLKYPATPRLADFFEPPRFPPPRDKVERSSTAAPRSRTSLPARKKRRNRVGRGGKPDSE